VPVAGAHLTDLGWARAPQSRCFKDVAGGIRAERRGAAVPRELSVLEALWTGSLRAVFCTFRSFRVGDSDGCCRNDLIHGPITSDSRTSASKRVSSERE
jgi:hypothetical protein